VSFATERLGTSSRVDRGSADLAPDEPRVKSERRSMPPHARGRERAILTRFRLVAFTSCPFQTGAVRSNGAIPRTSFAVVRLSLENENAKTPLLF
jgi:hypothetical protein